MLHPIFCATSSHSHSAQKPKELTFTIAPMSSSSPLVHNDKEFSYTETSIPFACVNKNACAGELESVNLQSSSSKRKARHFILTKFDLDRDAELTPRNKKLYNVVQTRVNALCKLREMYRQRN